MQSFTAGVDLQLTINALYCMMAVAPKGAGQKAAQALHRYDTLHVRRYDTFTLRRQHAVS